MESKEIVLEVRPDDVEAVARKAFELTGVVSMIYDENLHSTITRGKNSE